MALLLRVVTIPKWEKTEAMRPQDVPSDALSDLRSTSNAMSVWRVEPDKSNLDCALVAVASNREHLDKLDYALVDEAVFVALAIKCVKSDGKSPHRIASTTMHWDLTELTVEKVSNLASKMMPLERVRVPQRRIALLLRTAMKGDELDHAQMPPRLLKELESA